MKVTTNLKEISFKIIALTLGLIVGLVIGEIGSRFYYFGGDALDFQKINSFVTIGYTGFLQPADDQYVWYEVKPNLNELFKMRQMTTNSQGLRDQEYSLKKPANTYRVAVIGDSFTFGDGVDNDSVYHAIVEQKLNSKSDSLQIELLNFGVAGYDLLNYLGVIQAKALAYEPDLILIGFCGNNDDDLADEAQWNQPFTGYKHQEYSWFIKNLLLVRTIGSLIGSRRRLKGEASGNKRELKIPFVKKMFGMLGEVQRETDVPFAVFYLSMADAAASKAQLVKEMCDRENFDFIDSSPVVDTISDISRFWVHPTDHHPNEAMHKIYSEVLLEYFQ
jgi:hypothetical protein